MHAFFHTKSVQKMMANILFCCAKENYRIGYYQVCCISVSDKLFYVGHFKVSLIFKKYNCTKQSVHPLFSFQVHFKIVQCATTPHFCFKLKHYVKYWITCLWLPVVVISPYYGFLNLCPWLSDMWFHLTRSTTSDGFIVAAVLTDPVHFHREGWEACLLRVMPRAGSGAVSK